MNKILKLGFRLFLFSLIAAAALAVTNEITKGPIAEQKLAAKLTALKTVLPECEYEQIEFEGLAEDSELDEIFIGKDSSGAVCGYALTASPQGYGGEIPITMGISSEGYVTQVYVGALQETAGLGSRVGDEPFKSQFVGIAADPSTLRNDVDKISGASVSSGAFLNASEQILAYAKETLGIEPHAGDKEEILARAGDINKSETASDKSETEKISTASDTRIYDVTGFQPFKVQIELDDQNHIVSVSVPEHNETPGLGADLISDETVFTDLIGKSISEARIDIKSGVTLTSNAINDALRQASEGNKADGHSSDGGVLTFDVTGFQPFKVAVSLDSGNRITGVSVPEHNETPGLGAALIEDSTVFDNLVGLSIGDAQIDVRSGVTLTSNAINDALKQAAEAVNNSDSKTKLPSGDPYTVKGMNKFTVYLEIEDGKIKSITVPENNETPGLGAGLLTEDALTAYIGKDLASVDIDAKAGVTLTINALKDALEQAAIVNGIHRERTDDIEKDEHSEESIPVASRDENQSAFTKVYDVTGFQPFRIQIDLDEAGKILSVSVPEHAETPGLGAELIADTSVFERLRGINISEAQIDVKTGVTLTSNAINQALKNAANDAGTSETGASEHSASREFTVTGFQPFTVRIEWNDENKLTGITIPENNETPGLGADLIADTSIFDALIGSDITEAAIDVKSGVTLTSNAINDALKQAAGEAGK